MRAARPQLVRPLRAPAAAVVAHSLPGGFRPSDVSWSDASLHASPYAVVRGCLCRAPGVRVRAHEAHAPVPPPGTFRAHPQAHHLQPAPRRVPACARPAGPRGIHCRPPTHAARPRPCRLGHCVLLVIVFYFYRYLRVLCVHLQYLRAHVPRRHVQRRARPIRRAPPRRRRPVHARRVPGCDATLHPSPHTISCVCVCACVRLCTHKARASAPSPGTFHAHP
ncbi:hypothetical protein B0H10DRAFT_404666 [Mycena sp. CBHHK59/15]|nr:hypothetical protein B0H10DRAFT_404666 [Mycena sp. CBHHK59/15]